MTDNFYAPPHSIEAEQAVIGGLLLDDDSSERVRKVLAMLKPDSFYSRPHKIIFEEITRMHREQKPVDGLTLFDELERKSLTVSVGGFAYIAEIAKNTPSAANIVAYAMQVRETAMERYAINRMTEATELLYSRNGMTATQKYEAIQAIFTQLTDHAKTGSRRGLRSFGEVMEDWVTVSASGLQVGDAFTIAGVNSVHQITKDTTGQPQVFRVLAVSGTTVTISPKILPVENTDVASRPYANVDAKPAESAAITILNKNAAPANLFWADGSVELMYGKLAFPTGQGPQVMTATTEQGATLIMSYAFDHIKGVTTARFTTLYGCSVLVPEYTGIVIAGQ